MSLLDMDYFRANWTFVIQSLLMRWKSNMQNAVFTQRRCGVRQSFEPFRALSCQLSFSVNRYREFDTFRAVKHECTFYNPPSRFTRTERTTMFSLF